MGLFDKPRKIADIFATLRNKALSLDPVQIGLTPEQSNPIFGVLMKKRDGFI